MYYKVQNYTNTVDQKTTTYKHNKGQKVIKSRVIQ